MRRRHAAMMLAALCWTGLPRGEFKRVGAFTLVLLAMKGRFVYEFVYSFWVRQPLPMAFLATGQFFLETLALGLMVALAWSISTHGKSEQPEQ
ncbi:hypothetical protein HT136_17775 [Novosphingobium profundi]|uniref:hypothetical protein n=1 Tax=Novosphingobium profundi TaxID=1774954 RepID=UPI001BDA5A42|nr:hypothetical protein [Novosphingobium profundi]MBT0670219.1 hypothetical protein [Novosphingobium profundi]